ncbi:alcohol-forming fatty acyl-CoA reductase-like [Diospyros lotus]|uniref:alcohol-forming fatty acyl-CoA reductase-like n=1 Tax=Diospyros lotus TaxID=55363 RepID=UPI00225B3772|nr:alcohol-forming fatty acyl-CoA reductase-like [Diospyros lotus]
MELPSILQFLESRTILVTGATGFLAKIFVEKILRAQPNVKKLYLLLRAADAKSASQRLHNEVISKDLFRVLREKMGANLSSLLAERVTPVAGDISANENLGVKDLNLVEEMWREVDIVVNMAATTNFDERYDVALHLNTLGAKHVLDFSKKCAKTKMLLHVSTAYVSGERGGLILEKPYRMGEALNGAPGLDIDIEKKVVETRLSELQQVGATEGEITTAMKDLGIQRARKYGWPNTYVFTKAMGEMLLGDLKGNLPLVVIRPTIITSTFKEPFPGWIEGVRTVDSLYIGYGKGKLACFLGDPGSIIDVIPADLVVNAMMAAMAADYYAINQAAAGDEETIIYHVGSSVANPIRFTKLQDYAFHYFTKHPWIGKDGKPVKVGKGTVFSSMDSFRRYMAFRYVLPLKGLQLVNTAFCQYFQKMYMDLRRKINFVIRMAEIYQPYLFFKGIYDDINMEKLQILARNGDNAEIDVFYFDPKIINWDDYFMNTHIPGMVKYVFK